jgi:hypothetical protein
MRRRSACRLADQENLRWRADQLLERKGAIVLDAIVHGNVVQAGDLHQLVGDRADPRAHSSRLIDRRGNDACTGCRPCACDRTFDARDQCFTLFLPLEQCCQLPDLAEALGDGLRHAEQLEADAHPSQGVACRNRRVAAGDHEVGLECHDLFRRLVRVWQLLSDRRDGRAPGIARVLTQREDVLTRNQLDQH